MPGASPREQTGYHTPSADSALASDNSLAVNTLDAIAAFYTEHQPALGIDAATLLLRLNTWAAGRVVELSYADIGERMGWSRNTAMKHLATLQTAKLVKRLPVLLSRPNRWHLSDAGAFFAPDVKGSAEIAPDTRAPRAEIHTPSADFAPDVKAVTHGARAIEPSSSSSLRSEEENPEEDSSAAMSFPARKAEAVAAVGDAAEAAFEEWFAACPNGTRNLKLARGIDKLARAAWIAHVRPEDRAECLRITKIYADRRNPNFLTTPDRWVREGFRKWGAMAVEEGSPAWERGEARSSSASRASPADDYERDLAKRIEEKRFNEANRIHGT
jgi:hypothetical protein